MAWTDVQQPAEWKSMVNVLSIDDTLEVASSFDYLLMRWRIRYRCFSVALQKEGANSVADCLFCVGHPIEAQGVECLGRFVLL